MFIYFLIIYSIFRVQTGSVCSFNNGSQTSRNQLAENAIITNSIKNIPLQKTQSIGWMRVGAINHELASLRDGLPLIATSQPVTINPPVVPKLGDKIITVTGVNIRKKPPASPDYDPDKQEKLSVLNQPTRLVIIDKKTFVDPRRPSSTVVWAEVSLNDD